MSFHRSVRVKLLGLSVPLAVLAFLLGGHNAAEASDQIYTLPFEGQYSVSCWFQWYRDPPCNYPSDNFHYGTDYVLGAPLAGGHPIHAAARGTALPCALDPYAGYSVVIDHYSGRVTRYLHFDNYALPANGQIVARGQTIGYEGSRGIGVTGPHLHFEAREGASRNCSSSNGTAVDPYGGQYSPGTYSWKTNPPSTGRDLDFSGDGYPDVMGKETSTGTICLVRGNGAGGWNDPGDPGCGTGSPIGWGWNVYNAIFRPGDFNGDGYPDVLARNPSYSGGTLCLIAGYRGDGPPPDYWIEDPPDPACGVGTPIGFDWNVYDWIIGPGDFNGDGFADVLARENWGAHDLCLIRGNGHGGWIFDPGGECGDGTKIGWGWGIYNSLVAPTGRATATPAQTYLPASLRALIG